jgi:hypothetical protein
MKHARRNTQDVLVMAMLENVLLGPFDDLRRFITGLLTSPPQTRVKSEAGLAAARATLSQAGCDLSYCSENNLHTGASTLTPEQLFDLAAAWQLWPRSSFFACPSTDSQGKAWLAYRWCKTIPIVKMRLKTVLKPRYLIYDLVWGVGAGGYHSFLVGWNESGATTFSILTTFPPTMLFMEGLHDQMNYDIYRQLAHLERTGVRLLHENNHPSS